MTRVTDKPAVIQDVRCMSYPACKTSFWLFHITDVRCAETDCITKIQNFITNGILTSRRHKNELHKKALLDPPKYHKSFIEYRNMYNKIVRISKQMFVDDNFKKFQKKPKKTWDFLNASSPLLSRTSFRFPLSFLPPFPP